MLHFVLSQSLLLFRAFQQSIPDSQALQPRYESQSLPLFRAFQPGTRRTDFGFMTGGRNPFFYSGHFNSWGKWGEEEKHLVAIPSFIQGISTNSSLACYRGVPEE